MRYSTLCKPIVLGFSLIALICTTSAQITETIRKTDIYADPGDEKRILGRLYPGTELKKIGKDKSGKYIKATVDFYIPLDALKEGRIAKGIGEMQVADDASIKLLSAKKEGEIIKVSVEITNNGEKNMDMSALLLFKLVDRKGRIGNLEFMESVNSVGIIKPGKTIRSQLVYKFEQSPKDLEISFQSKLDGDKVFFTLGF